MNEDEILQTLRGIQVGFDQTKHDLAQFVDNSHDKLHEKEISELKEVNLEDNPIYVALRELSPSLALIYAQVKSDIAKNDRLTWGMTAHGIREVLRGILVLLAPDEELIVQPNYKQQSGTNGPTQKQRVKYILNKRGASSSSVDVVSEVDAIEERIGSLVRATYSRASDAAHGFKDKEETQRILRYFEAFAYDLLDLKDET
ncbi:MAG: hypothetical protein CL610_23200 [Anaerolineaceae bacterium]|nr:hypothetical protein [Anaerolineaceae bacterium]